MLNFVMVFTDTAMELYLRAFNEDDDKETVAAVCSSMAEILPQINYTIVEPCKGFFLKSFIYVPALILLNVFGLFQTWKSYLRDC
jgi:hypothetical protein